jgi:methionine-rich copper-binding protein CopC
MKHTLSLFALCAVAPVLAHGRLAACVPADGAVLSASPPQLGLRFDEPVEPALSRIVLAGPGGKAVALDKAHAGRDDARSLAVDLPRLAPGDYRARWTTAGHDGHRVSGEVRFTVK